MNDYDQQWPDYIVTNSKLRFHVSRPTRNEAPRGIKGLPAVARFIIDDYVDMTEDIQLWMHNLCWSLSPSITEQQAKYSWSSLMKGDRFITNRYGSDTNADYVNEKNLDNENMRLQPSACGGTILKITGEKRISGEDCWEFDAIDCLGNYKQYNLIDNWYMFYRPSNSVRIEIWIDKNGNLFESTSSNPTGSQWTGKYRENKSDPFPQYINNSIIPIFAVGNNKNYLPKWRIRILQPNEHPNPFVL